MKTIIDARRTFKLKLKVNAYKKLRELAPIDCYCQIEPLPYKLIQDFTEVFIAKLFKDIRDNTNVIYSDDRRLKWASDTVDLIVIQSNEIATEYKTWDEAKREKFFNLIKADYLPTIIILPEDEAANK